jgi:hypothetical protein
MANHVQIINILAIISLLLTPNGYDLLMFCFVFCIE